MSFYLTPAGLYLSPYWLLSGRASLIFICLPCGETSITLAGSILVPDRCLVKGQFHCIFCHFFVMCLPVFSGETACCLRQAP